MRKTCPLFRGKDPVYCKQDRSTAFCIEPKGGFPLGVRERILTIRILEKVKAHRAYAEALGITWNANGRSKLRPEPTKLR